MVYNPTAGRLVYEREFADDQIKEALAERAVWEKHRPEYEATVLSAESREDMIRTHGRYFRGGAS